MNDININLIMAYNKQSLLGLEDYRQEEKYLKALNKEEVKPLHRLPFFFKEDMNFFKEKTMNQIVIMGMNTWLSLDEKPLKNRINIILTKNKDYHYSSKLDKNNQGYVFIFNDLEKAIDYAKKVIEYKTYFLEEKGINYFSPTEIYIIGGKSIYQQSIPYINNAYITLIDMDFPVYFLDEKIKPVFVEPYHLTLCNSKNHQNNFFVNEIKTIKNCLNKNTTEELIDKNKVCEKMKSHCDLHFFHLKRK